MRAAPRPAFAQRRRLAGLLLLGAVFLFVISLLWAKLWPEQAFWAGALKALSEAAMVGGLADWFAVSALFRRVPLPVIGRHSNILVNNQGRIARNLALFVRQHFFNPESIERMLARHDLPLLLARWLRRKDNRQLLAGHVLRALQGALASWDDAPIRRMIQSGVQQALREAELRPALARALAILTHEGRHQELLDTLVTKMADYLAQEDTHGRFAQALVAYLQEEYPKLEKLLPSQSIGHKGASMMQSLIQHFFRRIQNEPDHFVRQEINAWVARSLYRIEHDPEWAQKIRDMQAYAASNPDFQRFAQGIWDDVCAWLQNDLSAPQGRLQRMVQSSSLWLAQTLLHDAALRTSLQTRLQATAQHVAPELGQFVEGHIASTLAAWDSQVMVAEIEQQVGADLQTIRINGTLLGGCIGLLLWLAAQLVNFF